MGQQQLLLVILVTILVGIATVVAINVFGDAAEQANRDAVRQDLLQASASVQAIWAKPTILGGAGNNFGATNLSDEDILRNIAIPGRINADGDLENENATYDLTEREGRFIEIEATPASWRDIITLRVERLEEEDTDGRIWIVTLRDGDDEVQEGENGEE